MDGPGLLNDFLKDHEVSREQCAIALKVSRTALYYWLTGKTAPAAAARDDIAVWTGGNVPAEAWGPQADHRKKDDGASVEPFSEGGHGR